MGLSGLIGAGANEGLEDLLARQLLQQQQAERERAQRAQEGLQTQRLEQDASQHSDMLGLRGRELDQRDTERRDESNRFGVADMERQGKAMAEQEAAAKLEALIGEMLPQLDPAAQRKLKLVGPAKMSAEDLRTPEEIAAADKRDIEQYATKMGAGAEAQARAAAKYREPKPEGPGGLQPSQITTAKQFQDDYYRDSKTYVTVRNAFQQVAGAAKNPDAAGDLSLIFGYMKMLDPNSVVRETEFANAQNAAGVPDQVRNLYNRAVSGERLNPRQRDQFVGQAQRLMQSAHENQQRVRKTYGDRSSKFGIDPSMVLDDEEPMPGGGSDVMRRPIPGIQGAEAESTDGGKTWKRVK